MWIGQETSSIPAPQKGADDSRQAKSGSAPEAPKAPPPAEFQEWGPLVEEIRRGDQRAMEQLYKIFAKGIRFQLCRQLGLQELDDKVHDIFLIVVQAIQRGELREPERLMGFVRTILRRQVATHIAKMVQSRREFVDAEASLLITDQRQNPEQILADSQKVQLMREALRGISPRDREILTRFYLQEQSPQQICAEMGLSETQFRLLKSRAKARFGEQGRRKLTNTLKFFMRKPAR
jgi:RNA polymerase sigma-70 factor (ECF subfamily)